MFSSLPADCGRRLQYGLQRIATVWYRPSEKTLRTPEYFVHETNDWLVLPYEMSGFSIDELKTNRPEMRELLERLAPYVKADDELPVG